MSAIEDLRNAIDHVTVCTGDPAAWKRGLAPGDLAAVTAAAVDPAAVTGVLAKLRANNPTLFDPRTGSPVTPRSAEAESPSGQQGDAAAAMRKAEDDLAQQNSLTAELDLHVVCAILNAHAETVEGSERLRRLQQEVEEAVGSRTDLDTPAGARDFQRFLTGKLRQIGAVVETASLDDTSKAALASAWTALYKNADGTEHPGDAASGAPDTVSPARAGQQPASPQSAAVVSETMPPYGPDLADDPLLDALLAQGQTTPAGIEAPAGNAPAPPPPSPVQPGLPLFPMAAAPGPTAPPLSSVVPADLTRPDLGSMQPRSARLAGEDLPIAAFLDEEDDPFGAASGGPAGDAAGGDCAEQTERPEVPAPPAPSTTVRLPDGSSVEAPTATIADVLRNAIGGTPIVEAFREEGIVVPPPGTAVAHPVDPSRVVGGDIGMFSDRQAVALDRERALLGGRIQPVASVAGPSFLGWLHPQGPGTSASAPSSTPMQDAPPTPTRPATAAAR